MDLVSRVTFLVLFTSSGYWGKIAAFHGASHLKIKLEKKIKFTLIFGSQMKTGMRIFPGACAQVESKLADGLPVLERPFTTSPVYH